MSERSNGEPKGCAGTTGGPVAFLFLLLVVFALLGSASASALPPSNALRYVHDADGRLKAVVDPEGQTAVYSRDAAGNLLSISRHASTTLAIIQLFPGQAGIGETVMIEGTGFSTTSASDVVKFNGTTASVSAATSTSLTVEVPAEAESGPITVSTPGEGPVTSSQSFTVVETLAPHITTLSPGIATAGEEVTISGSNFEENIADDIVTFNGVRPLVDSASSSAIDFKVPTATLGGKVSLSSPRGASEGSDLFVPPNGISPSKVGDIDRMSIGGSATTEISSEGKKGLDLFDGLAGEKIAFLISESSFAGKVSIWSPRDGKLSGSEVSFTKSGGGIIEPVTLPDSGTYTVLLEGEGTQTGSLKFAAYKIKDQTGSITPTEKGVEQAVSITAPGQNARFSVPVSAGEVVSVKASSSTFKKSTYNLEWRLPAPSGELLSGHFIFAGGGFLRQEFAASGTYTLVVNPEDADTGAVTLTVYDASDHTGSTLTPTEEGASETFPVEVPGQHNLITFSGSKEEEISLVASKGNFDGKVVLKSPAGSTLGSASIHPEPETRWIEPITLPEAGTYTIVLEGQEAQTGKTKLSAYKIKDQTGSITPTEKGVEQAVSITAPGQNARFSVPVSAGGVVSVKAPSSSFSSFYYLEWYKPGGEYLGGGTISSGGGFLRQQFSSSSTYTLVLKPVGFDTGAVTLTVYDASDHTGSTLTPTEEGASETFPVEVPGQHNLITFSGSKEEEISLVASKGNFDGKVVLKSPAGSTLGSASIHPEPETRWIEPITLPEAGTYTIVLEGQEAQTGKTKLSAYKIKDQTGSITPTEKGVEQAVSITAPGQNARFSVPVSAGGVVSVKAPSSSFSSFYYLEWYKPGGEYLGGGTISSGGGFLRQQFSSLSTYTLVLKPVGFDTGAVTLTVYDASDHTGSTLTPTEEGASETFPVEVPGQHNLITFSGSKEEEISLVASKGNFDGKVVLKSPAGSTLGSANIHSNGETRSIEEVTLPENGTYTLVLEGLEAQTGTVKLSAYLFIAWHPPSGFEAELVSLDTPHQSPVPDRHRLLPQGRLGSGSRLNASISSSKSRPIDSSAASRWLPPETSRGSRGWETNGARSPWAEVAPLHAGPGETALAGQVLEQDGHPLRGIKVSLEGAKEIAKTDAAGRFLLAGVPAGHQILVVNGDSPKQGQHFGAYEMGVKLNEGSTTTLEYTVWLTALDPAGDQRIASPAMREEILKSPRIPGLEVRLPKGTVIRNPAGRRVKNLNITAIPVDRPPAPLPGFQTIPLYYTIQPGRAYLSKGARIIYPNWTHLPPGQRVAFWNYDADNRGWYIYGHGSVSANGKQIVPDSGVRVWEFTGAMISGTPTPPPGGPIPGSGTPAVGGDPVDLHSGLFTYHRTDLVLPDTIPIVIERTYRQADSNSYSFGIGTKNPYDFQLWSTNNYHEADLILPDGGRVHFVRTSPGEGFLEAIYRSTSSPGEFYGSTLSWDGATSGWDLKLKSGLTYLFGDLAPLQGIRDQFGNELKLTREGGPTGRISKITSPHGKWVEFAYDGTNRITEITDNGGQHLKYKYEDNRLVKATDAASRTTEYEYDGSGNMASVIDGRGIKYLETEYDANDRVSKQTDADGGSFEFSYELNGKGEVIATALTEPPEGKRKVQFNTEGFPTSEAVGVETEDEETTAFERQPATGLLLSTTDPLGRNTAFKYGNDGNIEEITKLAETTEAQSSKFTYEPGTEELLTATDPVGNVTEYEYGPEGQLLSQLDALKHETSVEYNEDGQPTAITDPEGDTTELSYDNGDLTAVTDPLGRETTQFVDALGRVRAVATPSKARTRYSYNEDGQLTAVVSPSGATTALEYDEDGNPIKLTDPLENETSATYDVMDRLESETNGLKHTAEWTYDTGGNLVEAVDRRGKVSKFAYDPLGRVEGAQFGVSGEGAESTIGYEYDEANRLKGVKHSASGEYSLEYNKLDQLTELAGARGAVGYRYDEVGRREAMEVPGQEPVEYGYDNANRLTEIARGSEAVVLKYDEANRPESVLLPDGIEESYGYAEAGELTSISFEKEAASLGDLNYVYDIDGQTEAIWGSLARTGIPEALGSTEYNADNDSSNAKAKNSPTTKMAISRPTAHLNMNGMPAAS